MAYEAPFLSQEEQQIEEGAARLYSLPLFTFSSLAALKKAIFWAFFPEYLSLPLFYWLSTHKMLGTAYLVHGLFLAGSSYLQLSGFKYLINNKLPTQHGGMYGDGFQRRAKALLAPIEQMMGVPVKFMGLRKWHKDMASLAPNYLNVIFTVLAIATVEHEWVPYREVFRRRWAGVGSYVGEAGLPNILKAPVSGRPFVYDS